MIRFNSGQNLGTLLGKVLRIDVNGASPYAIPPDNPFVGVAGVLPEIFAYGLRNVWRMSFDRLTGDLFLGDVGQGEREEIDLIPATSGGGENFGWRVWEGTRCNTSVATPSQCAALIQTPPILEYDHSPSGAGTGVCGGSVTGGFRYRGSAIPALYGRYVFADYCTGRMWTAAPGAGGVWEKAIFADTGLLISSFGEDAAGELYFLRLERNDLPHRRRRRRRRHPSRPQRKRHGGSRLAQRRIRRERPLAHERHGANRDLDRPE